MGSDIGKGGVCGQILLVIINIVFIVLGIATLGIGIWAVVNGNTFSFVTGNQLIGGSVLLIIIGAVVVVIAAIGMFGAMCKSRPLLIIYAIVVLICVILEIIGGILIFVYRNELESIFQRSIEENLISAYDARDPGSEATILVNLVQRNLNCCGFTNASDWVRLNLDAITSNEDHPPACLVCNIGEENCGTFEFVVEVLMGNVTKNFNTTTMGCAGLTLSTNGSDIANGVLGIAIGAGAVGIVFGLFEITGIIVALILCCCISRARKQTVV